MGYLRFYGKHDSLEYCYQIVFFTWSFYFGTFFSVHLRVPRFVRAINRTCLQTRYAYNTRTLKSSLKESFYAHNTAMITWVFHLHIHRVIKTYIVHWCRRGQGGCGESVCMVFVIFFLKKSSTTILPLYGENNLTCSNGGAHTLYSCVYHIILFNTSNMSTPYVYVYTYAHKKKKKKHATTRE